MNSGRCSLPFPLTCNNRSSPSNYKEKHCEDGDKEDKFNVWFIDRAESFFQSVFIGFQGPGSSILTIRYYLTNYHNQDLTETKDGVTTKPYDGFNANVLAISLGYGLFEVRKRMPPKSDKPAERTAWDRR